MLKNEVKKPSYLVGSRLGSILGDFLRKLGDFFSKSSGHTALFKFENLTALYNGRLSLKESMSSGRGQDLLALFARAGCLQEGDHVSGE